jgi:HAD superfamily hydrolase (TIGR01549 family)
VIAPDGTLAVLAAACQVVLLDFDGPICRLYATVPAHTVAARVRAGLAASGAAPDPTDTDEADPLDLLRAASRTTPEHLSLVHAALRSAELDAIATAAPTPGAVQLVDACRKSGRRIGVVSNNSTEAVTAYLRARDMYSAVDVVVGRSGTHPELLKPSPHLVKQAVTALDAVPSWCLLVGDSVSDISAARAAGVRSIGYANRPDKRMPLADAGADFVIDDLRVLARALAP